MKILLRNALIQCKETNFKGFYFRELSLPKQLTYFLLGRNFLLPYNLKSSLNQEEAVQKKKKKKSVAESTDPARTE